MNYGVNNLCETRIIDSRMLGTEWSEDIILENPGEARKIFVIFNERVPEKTRIRAYLRGRGARLEILFGIIGKKDNRANIEVACFHEGKDTFARVTARAALFDESRLMVRGVLDVSQTARGSDTYFLGNAYMLSGSAHAEFFPHLEIKTSDVKASHGSSVGRVNERDLFYLESRGIDRTAALHILLGAFFRDIAQKIPETYHPIFFQC